MTTATLVPSTDQQRALAAVREWYAASPTRPFVLGGLAGTGKTALLPMIHTSLRPIRIRYVCPTWKAAGVLSRKLKQAGISDQATSIHNLIYNPRGLLHDADCGMWNNPDEGCTMNCKKLAWEFDPKDHPQILVVDEASMVDQRTREDIERLDCPTLYVGDVGQLPPIVGNSIFDDLGCDALLENIQRQAQDSPIIPLSRLVRSGTPGWLGKAQGMGFPVYDAGPASSRRYDVAAANHGEPSTVFVAGRNDDVDRLNRLVRKVLGRGPEPLVPGDLIMAQNNPKARGIYNGQTGVVTDVLDGRSVRITMETGLQYAGPVLIKGIDEIPTYPEVPVVRHAYAVTCHKAQGSEFQNVVIYLAGSRVETKQWLYTAVTRSTDKLAFVRA